MPLRDLRFSDLRDLARDELNTTLGKLAVAGDKTKTLLVEPRLLEAMEASGLAAECFTAANGVLRVAPLDIRETVESDSRMLVLLVRPSLPLMKEVAAVVHRCHETYKEAAGKSLHSRILFVPKKTFICCHLLEAELGLDKLKGQLEIDEIEVDFFLAEEDVLSMEMPGLFREVFMDGDTTALQFLAKTLVKLQTGKIGLVPKIYAKGNVAARTLDFVRRMTADVGVEFMQEQASIVDRIYLIDRSVDLATPLATQLTYEGLIDEQFGLVLGTCRPPFEMKNLKKEHKGVAKLHNSVDEIYYAIRDLNFAQVAAVLHEFSLSVKAEYDRRRDLQTREMCDFIKRMPEKSRLVGVHTEFATLLSKTVNGPAFRRRIEMEQNVIQQADDREVLDYIEELMNKGEPMVTVLRLLCLMSIVQGGLKAKVYDSLKESFMLSYGIPQTLAGWYNLERAGLLTKNNSSLLAQAGAMASLATGTAKGDKDGRLPFSSLRKACKLWVDNLNEKNPTDVAYAYSGYAPLLLRCIEGLELFNAKINRSGGARAHPAFASFASRSSAADANAPPRTTGIPVLDQAPGEFDALFTGTEVASATKTVLIVVIGGTTSAELNAIRRILGTEPELEQERTQYVVATTAITTGPQMIKSLLPFDP